MSDGQCEYNKTGVCAFHRDETANIRNLQKFAVSAKTIGVVATLVWLGGFTYTYLCHNRDQADISELRGNIGSLSKSVSSLSGLQLVTDEKFNRLIDQIENTNRRLSELVDKMPVATRP